MTEQLSIPLGRPAVEVVHHDRGTTVATCRVPMRGAYPRVVDGVRGEVVRNYRGHFWMRVDASRPDASRHGRTVSGVFVEKDEAVDAMRAAAVELLEWLERPASEVLVESAEVLERQAESVTGDDAVAIADRFSKAHRASYLRRMAALLSEAA